MAEMCYWEAIRAGVDGLDVCVSSLGMGPGHPPIESFIAGLRGTPRDPKIDLAQFTDCLLYTSLLFFSRVSAASIIETPSFSLPSTRKVTVSGTMSWYLSLIHI